MVKSPRAFLTFLASAYFYFLSAKGKACFQDSHVYYMYDYV